MNPSDNIQIIGKMYSNFFSTTTLSNIFQYQELSNETAG